VADFVVGYSVGAFLLRLFVVIGGSTAYVHLVYFIDLVLMMRCLSLISPFNHASIPAIARIVVETNETYNYSHSLMHDISSDEFSRGRALMLSIEPSRRRPDPDPLPPVLPLKPFADSLSTTLDRCWTQKSSFLVTMDVPDWT
jgi:hypothetical protein